MLQEQHIAAGLLDQQCADAHGTTRMLNEATRAWHDGPPAPQDLLQQMHLANFELWHLEDLARDTHSGDAAVAATKRNIDVVNQRRNDIVESIDSALLARLQSLGLPNAQSPLHSETPGQILDRLSILSLKIFHTVLEIERANVPAAHVERNAARLTALQTQQSDLAECLAALWQEVLAGRRRFKLYQQLKMYNDPALNPVLYSAVQKL